jgi:predicted RND superfamily exporter protein
MILISGGVCVCVCVCVFFIIKKKTPRTPQVRQKNKTLSKEKKKRVSPSFFKTLKIFFAKFCSVSGGNLIKHIFFHQGCKFV